MNPDQKEPDELGPWSKFGLAVAGAAFAVLGVVLAFNFPRPGPVILFITLAIPAVAVFFRGYRYFSLGFFLAVVGGCVVPVVVLLVICGFSRTHM